LPGHDDFVLVRQFAEPVVEVFDCLHAFGKHGEVAGVNGNVSGGYVNLAMELVCVAEED
jgi:hypothetical protein